MVRGYGAHDVHLDFIEHCFGGVSDLKELLGFSLSGLQRLKAGARADIVSHLIFHFNPVKLFPYRPVNLINTLMISCHCIVIFFNNVRPLVGSRITKLIRAHVEGIIFSSESVDENTF